MTEPALPTELAGWLRTQPFQGYAYSYPHKQAYRRFDEPVPLAPVWEREDRDRLFLYVHIPFCEMRCGFCNLFTTTNPGGGLVGRYLDSLSAEADAAAEFIGGHRFARGAIGGGTPSFLDERELERLFGILGTGLGGIPPGMPLSFETSPATVSAGKLALLRERGVTRLSIGVQSFIEAETRQLGRPQDGPQLDAALAAIRDGGFPVVNLDLIYGMAGQTAASWGESLRRAVAHAPGELYLYPLYVRPLTGLGRAGRAPVDDRLPLYRQGRDVLLSNGYHQVSMRLFRRDGLAAEDAGMEGPVYCCQEDGMLGLGAGARSYTKSLHYSTEYAVGRTGVAEIIGDYTRRTARDHHHAVYGCLLPPDEQRRRHVIKSLLRLPGLDLRDYAATFGASPLDDYPDLGQLVDHGLATCSATHLTLTAAGLERSDTIGPWLSSPRMAARIDTFQLR